MLNTIVQIAAASKGDILATTFSKTRVSWAELDPAPSMEGLRPLVPLSSMPKAAFYLIHVQPADVVTILGQSYTSGATFVLDQILGQMVVRAAKRARSFTVPAEHTGPLVVVAAPATQVFTAPASQAFTGPASQAFAAPTSQDFAAPTSQAFTAPASQAFATAPAMPNDFMDSFELPIPALPPFPAHLEMLDFRDLELPPLPGLDMLPPQPSNGTTAPTLTCDGNQRLQATADGSFPTTTVIEANWRGYAVTLEHVMGAEVSYSCNVLSIVFRPLNAATGATHTPVCARLRIKKPKGGFKYRYQPESALESVMKLPCFTDVHLDAVFATIAFAISSIDPTARSEFLQSLFARSSQL